MNLRHIWRWFFVFGVVFGAIAYLWWRSGAGRGDFANSERVFISRVIDGDTVDLEGGKRVRLIGIDAPEMWMDPPTATQSGRAGCFAEESKNKLKELVENKEVRLEKDVSETDKYDRLLRYVFVGEENVSEVIIRDGFARLATYPPDTKYYAKLKIVEKEAKEKRLGLWGMCPN